MPGGRGRADSGGSAHYGQGAARCTGWAHASDARRAQCASMWLGGVRGRALVQQWRAAARAPTRPVRAWPALPRPVTPSASRRPVRGTSSGRRPAHLPKYERTRSMAEITQGGQAGRMREMCPHLSMDPGPCVHERGRNEVAGASGRRNRMRMLPAHLSRGSLVIGAAMVEVDRSMVPAPRTTGSARGERAEGARAAAVGYR